MVRTKDKKKVLEEKESKKIKKKEPLQSFSFPDEVIVCILSFLSEEDLCRRAALVSKKWYVLSSLDSLWEPLYWDQFSNEDEEEIEEDQEPLLWKNRYKLKIFEVKNKFITEEPLQQEAKDLRALDETLKYLSPQERFAMAFEAYKSGIAMNKEERYDKAFILLRKAAVILEKTLAYVLQEQTDYPSAELVKWTCLLGESLACKAFSLRRKGHLVLALGEYRKGFGIVQQVINEDKNPAMSQFAKEIQVSITKNMGVVHSLLHQYNEAVEVYNKGIAILEERVDTMYREQKLNLIEVVNLLTYLTNRIFVSRHVKRWEDIAADALNVANTFIHYKREKDIKMLEKMEIAPEYEEIEELFTGMVQDQILRWPLEEQYKLLGALRKHGTDHILTQALATKLNPLAR